MTLDTFGYNGVFELNDGVVNRLLAAQVYENNLVLTNGQVTNPDFLAPIEFPQGDGSTIRVYMLTGRPEVSFQGHDGSNKITLFVPLFGLGVFKSLGDTTQPVDLGLQSQRLGLAISDIAVQQDAAALKFDFSGVDADSVVVRAFTLVEPPTHVGGRLVGSLDLTDAFLDAQFQKAGSAITGKDLRTQVAIALQGNKLGQNSVPINPGGIESEIGAWDLMTFDQSAGGVAGAMLELYEPGGNGQGRREFGLDIIPAADSPPAYRWTAALRKDVLLRIFGRYFDKSMYPQQGNALNTSDNPWGFMVVPPAGKATYSLPSHDSSVVVSAPAGGQVQVDVTAGFAAHARARLQVLGTNREESLTADTDGTASVSIKANVGDRLAFAVDATSMASDSSVVIWRPRISFQDGTIRLDLHFYKYLDIPCDAEGDGYVVLELYADRTSAFQFGLRVTDSHFDIPYRVFAAAWFGGNMLSVIGGALTMVLVATVGEDMIRDKVDPQKQADTLLGDLRKQLPAPQAPNNALFLDDLITSEDGLVLAGRADAGRIVSYGRTAAVSTGNGAVLQNQGFYAALDWEPSLGPIKVKPRGRAKTGSGAPADSFWSATYDDLPYPPYPISADSAVLNAGDTALFFVDSDTTLAKILVERPPVTSDVPSVSVLITWVAYQKRVAQAVRI